MTADERSGAGRWVPAGAQPDRLAEAAQSCRGCELWRGATQTVFGEGSSPARVMLVGEQPGDREDLTGEPFVGPAGATLDRALAAAGIARGDIYLTNAVKHFRFEERGKRRIPRPRPDGARDGASRGPAAHSGYSGPTSRFRVFRRRSACCRTGGPARALGGRTAATLASAARHARVVSTICPPAASHVMYSLFAPQERERPEGFPFSSGEPPHRSQRLARCGPPGLRWKPPSSWSAHGLCLGREDPGQSI